MSEEKHGFTIKIVRKFLESNISIVLILLALAAGAVALTVTPREEEPQIVIPAADIYVSFPGRSAKQIEQLVSSPLERYLSQIDGVEYVYSRSMPGQAIVTVRFYVGQDRERSLVKLNKWLSQNADRMPPGIAGMVVKPIETDDVPIVTLTFTSPKESDYQLRRVAEEVLDRLQGVPRVGLISIVGGEPRQMIVRLHPERLAGFHLSPTEIARAIQATNAYAQSGSYTRADEEIRVESGRFVRDRHDLENLVVASTGDGSQARPVYLRDVADISDGPGEVVNYVRFSQGPAWGKQENHEAAGNWAYRSLAPGQSETIYQQPGVSIALSKQKGANNVLVAHDILERFRQIRDQVVPTDVSVAITRNYGVTANAKVDELVEGLAVGIVVVLCLLTMGLGFTESLVVAVTVPCVFGLTLIINFWLGFSINRVTLFALTVALGLLVDDPIVDVENIRRHFDLRQKANRDIVLEAVNEIRPPLIAATLAVIISFLPLFFVTEEMHDYLRPMAVNVPMTMIMSMVVSFTITPWLTFHALRHRYATSGGTLPSRAHIDAEGEIAQTRLYHWFRPVLEPLLTKRWRGYLFLAIVVLMFIASILLVLTRKVQPKQLPFDNKDEVLLVLDMPSGTTLERTDAAARDFENYLRQVPEVTDFETYVGTHSPVDFNGLSRKYFLREAANRGDIRVNLIHKTQRDASSHVLALRMREGLTEIAQRHGVKLKIVELPAGPPVMSTVVAAVYGQPDQDYETLMAAAKTVEARMKTEPNVVDFDDSIDDDQIKDVFVPDRLKASAHGVSMADISQTLQTILAGQSVGIVETGSDRSPVPILVWADRAERSGRELLDRVYVRGQSGERLPLSELGSWQRGLEDKTIYHRNLLPVVYVTAEMAGRPPVETIIDLRADELTPEKLAALPEAVRNAPPRPLASRTMFRKGGGQPWAVPAGIEVKWWDEGEMRLTMHIFRDLGVGFAGALLVIYLLLVYQTGSFLLPVVIMMAIPLMVIGVLPGFWLLNHIGTHTVGAYLDPFFFSSPAMIGVIALSGIVTRNSIIIVDFVHLSLAKGRTLVQALVESCAVRLRPILLTSGAAMLGAWPITMDSVFAGLAWALIFGLIASTVFSLLIIPVTYSLIYERRPGHGLPENMRPQS
ncbi:efflux RND transporter permease subunit [Desulfatirhabdium butyrativorans]|uniref:efflux RND transporter permease subunit n=1 Tax=Desulfatirhabdium butyrativorans TaxID=340467 RepID=UPI0003F86DA5|nr:efflux RND transporter permease subunit [Desulfatirhabdium butyrativorans]